MAVLPTLFPTGQVSAGDWTDEAGGTTNLHLAIDESGAGGSDYIRGSQDAVTNVGLWELTDMPSDFGTMTSIDVEIRHARGGVEGGDNGGGDDTFTLFLRLVAADASVLTDEMQIESGTVGYLAKTEVVSFTGVQARDKTVWDGARLQMGVAYSRSMGADGDRVWVDFVRIINGVYALAPGPLSQAGYRWRNDDGSETAATWKAAENANPALLALDTNHRLRYVVDETGGTAPVDNLQLQSQFRKNGGTWTNISGSSLNVRATTSTHFADDDATTRQLASGTGTFVTGAMAETGLAGDLNQIDFRTTHIKDLFGVNVFNEEAQKARLPKPVFKALQKTIKRLKR